MRQSRFGPLKVISAILLASAVLRTPILSSQAYAQSEGDPAGGVEAPSKSIGSNVPEMDLLIAELRQRENAIQNTELALRSREQKVIKMQGLLNEKVLQIREAEERLRALVSKASSAAEYDVNKLVAVYENMKPKDASRLFEEMEPNFAAGFLSQMRPEKSAPILSGLRPETAYAISAVLAGRNQESNSLE